MASFDDLLSFYDQLQFDINAAIPDPILPITDVQPVTEDDISMFQPFVEDLISESNENVVSEVKETFEQSANDILDLSEFDDFWLSTIIDECEFQHTNANQLVNLDHNEIDIIQQINSNLFNGIDGAMQVTTQPKANTRSRYESDGKRFLPDSRHHPMTISLPNVIGISLTPKETLGIVVTILTTNDNPSGHPILHENGISYDVPGTIEILPSSIFIPLTQEHIQNGEIKMRRFAIWYKKYEQFDFNIIPFNQEELPNTEKVAKYCVSNNPNMGKVQKGKLFKSEYHLTKYRLNFRLGLKQGNAINVSNIWCESNIIDEGTTSNNSRKRVRINEPGLHSTDRVEVPSSTNELVLPKRRKIETSQPLSLPACYVSKIETASSVDFNDLS